MSAETAMVRVGIGCGTTVALVVASILVTIATVVVAPWVNPNTVGHGGIGQGLGILLLPFLAAAPVIGLVAAWKPRIGIVLGVLLVLAHAALFAAALVDL